MQVTQEVTTGRTEEERESVCNPPALRRGVGRHLIAEFWDCNDQIRSPTAIINSLQKAVNESGATLLRLVIHTFEPYGVSAVAIVSESHFFIHTWPEMRYLALDVFTCGNTVPEKAVELIKQEFDPQRVKTFMIHRGIWP
ncbi:MAG: adenosylmethionine decarboxylase [Armatimonadetes bacterium]|nr:adenosylmethionine decarboxylase [Armatimonadota bacterium]MDW8122061.1 adenosylmethionine decarboxylase [Armatimonadota bacterium]